MLRFNAPPVTKQLFLQKWERKCFTRPYFQGFNIIMILLFCQA